MTRDQIEFEPFSRTQQVIMQNQPYSTLPNFEMYNPTMKNDPIVIGRSIINLNKRSPSIRPNHVIVERNGKQFLTELSARMERRYVQIFDETTSQIRLFEVTDYIPTKTVRSMKKRYHSLTPNFSINHRPGFPPTPKGRTTIQTASNLVHSSDLSKHSHL